MEAELTGAPKETSNTENLAVAEEANIGDAVTVEAKSSNDMENYLKEEQKIKYYKDKMNIDIENFNTIQKRNKVYTKQWRKIYEVIQQVF